MAKVRAAQGDKRRATPPVRLGLPPTVHAGRVNMRAQLRDIRANRSVAGLSRDERDRRQAADRMLNRERAEEKRRKKRKRSRAGRRSSR